MRFRFLHILSLFIILGCSNEDELRLGNVEFRVKNVTGNINGAVVGTLPETKISYFQNGEAFLTDIPQGVYEIYVSHQDLGYNSMTRSVFEDKTLFLEFDFTNSKISPVQTTIQILSPNNNSSFLLGSTINFEALISDVEDEDSELEIQLSSNKNGLIYMGKSIVNGKFSYDISDLFAGVHILEIAVTNSRGFTTRKEVKIELLLEDSNFFIDSIGVNEEGIYLAWSRVPSIISYEIHRGYSVEDIDFYKKIYNNLDTFYFDTDLNEGENVYYKIIYNLPDEIYMSDVRNIFYKGKSIYIGDITTEEFKINAFNNEMYVIDKMNDVLHFVNLESCESIAQFSFEDIHYLNLNGDGTRLYFTALHEFGQQKIIEIDLVDKIVLQEIYISEYIEYFHPKDIEWIKGNKILLVESGYSEIYMFDLDLKEVVFIGNQIIDPLITVNKAKDKVYIVHELSGFMSRVVSYEVNGSNLDVVANYVSSGSYWPSPVLSGDEKIVFVGKKKLDADDLTLLNNLNHDVLVSDYTGTYVAHEYGTFNSINLSDEKYFGYSSEDIEPYNEYTEIFTFRSSKSIFLRRSINE